MATSNQEGDHEEKSPSRYIPVDITIDILTRLPAKDVFRFHIVGRDWKTVTLNQYFVEMHKQNSTPAIVIKDEGRGSKRMELLSLDEWRATGKTTRINHVDIAGGISVLKYEFYLMQFSYDGLLVLKAFYDRPPCRRNFIILNPITREEVRIIPRRYSGEICGIFFHPSLKEYCVLFGLSYPSKRYIQFKMLNLGSHPQWKELNFGAPIYYRPKIIGRIAPVVVNDVIFWMADSRFSRATCDKCILTFDIKREEFSIMAHPHTGQRCNEFWHRYCMNLLEMHGFLAFVHQYNHHSDPNSSYIDIWILKDYANKYWIKSHTVQIEKELSKGVFRPLALVNGELLLMSGDKRIFTWNLKLCIVTEIEMKQKGTLFRYFHISSCSYSSLFEEL